MAHALNLKKSFEELEEIERSFRDPELNLDLAITRQTRAMELAKEIYEYLDTAENKLEQLTLDEQRKTPGDEDY